MIALGILVLALAPMLLFAVVVMISAKVNKLGSTIE